MTQEDTGLQPGPKRQNAQHRQRRAAGPRANGHNSRLVHDILRSIVATCAPEKVILFGSHARGNAGEDSDLDLLVVMNTQLPPLDRYGEVRSAIGATGLPVDVFVLTPEEFDETKDVIGGIAYAPAKYGRILYEKP
jgi:predicted nucleotidyltransferase